MSCKEIQELLLTDYIDGEVDTATRERIERHLLDCPSCLEFARAAQAAMEPVSQTAVKEVPAHVWNNIEQKLDQPAGQFNLDWVNKIGFVLEGLISQPRRAAVFAVILVVAVSGLTVIKNAARQGSVSKVAENQPVEYFAFLVEEEDLNGGYGTAIEEFFL